MNAPSPLHGAYAHRDCEFNPPLKQSLSYGFTHIEVDVYCLFGRVLVAHDLQQIRPWNTLERLYLEPLKTHIAMHQGRIYSDETPLWLFLDVKTRADSSFSLIQRVLSNYAAIITEFTQTGIIPKAINVIISGNRLPYQTVQTLPSRFASLDGRLPDLGIHTDPRVMPIISDNWAKHFSWRGQGAMPTAEKTKLLDCIQTAHTNQQKLRFWGTPDHSSIERKAVWDTLTQAGIDLINTDDLAGLKQYLLMTKS